MDDKKLTTKSMFLFGSRQLTELLMTVNPIKCLFRPLAMREFSDKMAMVRSLLLIEVACMLSLRSILKLTYGLPVSVLCRLAVVWLAPALTGNVLVLVAMRWTTCMAVVKVVYNTFSRCMRPHRRGGSRHKQRAREPPKKRKRV